jgi:hypothetical protein
MFTDDVEDDDWTTSVPANTTQFLWVSFGERIESCGNAAEDIASLKTENRLVHH